ncbi:MAG TPA: phospholipid carrier-dependent glycosyltransferase, partial [Thermoanaerobaculia bacterium]|nr:phospholipid carrier-dependent glycosyltransferase [Thermoanaerobaculia bacterium]
MRSRILWWSAAAIVLTLYTWGIASVPLFEPDEGRYAEIPREMLARGDLVTPHLDGVLYFEKPVLYYWLTAGALATLGHNELACRIWNAIFGLVGIALAFLLGRSIGGDRMSGAMAALVLATAPVYFAFSRVNSIDMLVSFLIGLCLTAFWFAQSEEAPRRRRLLWYLVALAAALAVLAKGLIGLLIPGAVAFLYILATRRWKIIPDFPWVGGGALFLLVAAPWHVLAALRNPDFLWFYFVHEHFLRYLTPEAHRSAPWWIFLAVILLGLAPWSGALAGIARGWRDLRAGSGRHRQYEGVIFLTSWAGFVLVFFSLSHSKLIPYVLPAILPAAVLAALALSLARQAVGGAWAPRGAAVTSLLPAILLLAGWLLLDGRFGVRAIPLSGIHSSFAWYRGFAAAAVAALVTAAAALWSRRVKAGAAAAALGGGLALAALL